MRTHRNTRTPRTLRQSIASAMLVPMGLLAGYAVVATTQPLTMDIAPQQPQVEAPATPGSPAHLIERYGCWTGDAPADMVGQVPGHAVVSKGDRTWRGGDKVVAQALAQTFDGEAHGLTVHAFCK